MKHVRVKICGITNNEDAQKAVFYGASSVGFIFYKKSPRYISPSKAKKIIDALPPFVAPVGVFVNLSERAVRDICKFTGIKTLQFHGDETAVFCKRFKGYKIIKAFRIIHAAELNNVSKYKVDAYLFDAAKKGEYGGTGETFDWSILQGKKLERPVILSGGINTENVLEAIDTVKPYAIDVSSGVEKSPGIKDPRLIRTLLDMVHFPPVK
jgi:phosphoribosylanthranilate isomerase